MKNLSLIAAIGKNNELGIDNHLIWSLKNDMKFFRKMTTGKTIIMGRKCFESLPGLLSNRKHIILSHNENYLVDGSVVYHNLEEVLDYVRNNNEECFIIGGAKIYEMFLPYCNSLYLTEINDEKEADCYFPLFNKDEYNCEVLENHTDEESSINYHIKKYTKKDVN